ncbi:hypothetical protein HMN09_00205600 [Mycena chlorophos]|uniref:Uncharacterized protein n=1 Tax=Mycena chlorophos TaxID=658473 RepID=A0A8H6WQU3_MYCCL|nr:hypothetical protein HMN09_00205600 [Mycena chlorophos]
MTTTTTTSTTPPTSSPAMTAAMALLGTPPRSPAAAPGRPLKSSLASSPIRSPPPSSVDNTPSKKSVRFLVAPAELTATELERNVAGGDVENSPAKRVSPPPRMQSPVPESCNNALAGWDHARRANTPEAASARRSRASVPQTNPRETELLRQEDDDDELEDSFLSRLSMLAVNGSPTNEAGPPLGSPRCSRPLPPLPGDTDPSCEFRYRLDLDRTKASFTTQEAETMHMRAEIARLKSENAWLAAAHADLHQENAKMQAQTTQLGAKVTTLTKETSTLRNDKAKLLVALESVVRRERQPTREVREALGRLRSAAVVRDEDLQVLVRAKGKPHGDTRKPLAVMQAAQQ